MERLSIEDLVEQVRRWSIEYREHVCGCVYLVQQGMARGKAVGRCSAVTTCAQHE